MVGVAVQSTGALKPKVPPKSRSSTLVAFEAEASSKVDPDTVAPLEGISTLVVGGGGGGGAGSPAGPTKAWIWVEDGARMRPSAAAGDGNDDDDAPMAKCWTSAPVAAF